jgi:protein-S-isoprenylcysteine O-methyltransferase Ste14
MKKKKRAGISIRTMVIGLLIALAFMTWVIAAAKYASDFEGFNRPDIPAGGGRGAAMRGGIALFVFGLFRVLWNAIVQIPNAHRVAWHTLTDHPVLLVVTAVVGTVILLLWAWWADRHRAPRSA